MKKSDRVCAARLVRVPSYSFTVVDGDSFHALFAWSDSDMEGLSAMDGMGYHVHLVKKSYILSNVVSFLSDFKPTSLMPLTASTEKVPESVPEKTYSDISPSEGDGTEERAAPG